MGGAKPLRTRLIEVALSIFVLLLVAAIMFPAFGGSYHGGPKTMALSNAKQLGLSLIMYWSDFDDNLPDCPGDGPMKESYVVWAKAKKYIRGNYALTYPKSPFPMGTVQHRWHDVPTELGGGFDMTPPDDPCVGLPPSGFGTTDSATSRYFDDVYPPTDIEVNPTLWGYVEHGCPTGGVTDGYSHPGANVSKGLHPLAPGGGNAGVNNLGPGHVDIEKPEETVLLFFGPLDKGAWPGPSLWGDDYPNYLGQPQGEAVAFLDGHAKTIQFSKMLAGTPGAKDQDRYPYNDFTVSEQNWNPPYDGKHPAYGLAFYWWGTQLANPSTH